MITPVLYPSKLSLAGNKVVFGFKTDEQIVSYGSKAVVNLYFGSLLFGLTGKQFKLVFSGREITFTSALHPDGSGTQFRSAVNGETNLGWMKKISEDLQTNYYVSMLYDITYDYNLVVLTAKSAGPEHNISGTNISVGSMSILSIAGVNDEVNPFFKIYLQVVSGSKILGEDFLPVDVSGRSYFDVAEYLKPEMKVNFAFPENVNTLMFLRNEARAVFFARYGLYYGTDPEVKKLTNTALFYALPGGVNSMTEGRYNALHTSFYNQLQVNHQFLTWHPVRRRTQADYMQKLWYIVHTPATQLKLKVRLNFDDAGMQQTVVLTKATMAVNMMDLVEICCGYDRMQLAIDVGLQDPDWTLLSYDVFLTNENDTLISELRNYYLDDRRTGFDRTFLFKNSFKLWETFVARGIQQIEPEYERVQINKIKAVNFTNAHADKQNYLNQENNKLTVDSGWISLQEKQWLSELLLSTEVYEVVGGILYPVVITATNKNPIVDRNFNHNVKIEYLRGYTDQHYSVEQSVMPLGLVPRILIAEPVNLVQEVTPGIIHLEQQQQMQILVQP